MVTGYSLFITFNYTYAQMTLHGLWTDTISAVEYLFCWTKNSVQYLWIRDNAGPDRAIWISLAVTEAKSCEVCTVYWTTGYFPKKWTMFGTKLSVWPSNMLKTVDLEYHSSLSVAWMVRFWLKSLHSSTVRKRLLIQGNLFPSGCVYTWSAYLSVLCLL